MSCLLFAVAAPVADARPVPSLRGLHDARAYAKKAERAPGARVSWAVISTRGTVYAGGGKRHHRSASQTKAMLLVAYLRRLGRSPVPPSIHRILAPMIMVSGNRAASRIHAMLSCVS